MDKRKKSQIYDIFYDPMWGKVEKSPELDVEGQGSIHLTPWSLKFLFGKCA